MARQKISRNDPCPCGSGKKFKHCCYGKDIDWSARAATARRPVIPRMVSKPDGMSFGQLFGMVDAKLKAIAQAHPDGGAWKGLVKRLSEATTAEDRIATYKAVRQAQIIPDEAGDFLILWAIQWLPPENSPVASGDEDEEPDEETATQELDNETLAQLRKFGLDDLAETFVSNRLEFDRRRERGRQFFYGPPDEELANSLRAKGIID